VLLLRIDPWPRSRYPFWLRPFFRSQERRYGDVLLPGLLWARVPRLFAAVALLYAALEYAEAMTETGQRVSDELMSRLKQAFDDDAIIELTALIAFQNLSSKFNSALDVPSQGFCRLPGGQQPDRTGR